MKKILFLTLVLSGCVTTGEFTSEGAIPLNSPSPIVMTIKNISPDNLPPEEIEETYPMDEWFYYYQENILILVER